MVLTNAMSWLDNAKLFMDKSGSNTFQGELRPYLLRKLDDRDSSKVRF